MKLYLVVIALFMLGIAAPACTKSHADPSGSKPVPGDSTSTSDGTGQATGTGTAIGTAVVKSIGGDGGSLLSDDQHLTLYVPAGATTQSQSITLQRITNQAPNGLGDAYRIKTASAVKKPFSVCWKYNKQLLQGAKPSSIAVAYQDVKGVWHASKDTHVDEQDSTICVDLQDGRPADVSFICETLILPQIDGKGTILTAEPIFIDIKRVPIRGSWGELSGATLVKDSILHLYVNGGDPHDGSQGNGSLSEAAYGTPHSLLYVAPDHIPHPNPVAVTASIQTSLGPVSVTATIPIEQILSMGSTVGGLDHPSATFLASEGGNLSISLWNDGNLEAPVSADVTITHFTKGKLSYDAGPDCEFRLVGDGKVYSSTYFVPDAHGVPVKTYGVGHVTISSITALAEHPGVGVLEGNFESEVFRPTGGSQYERGTVTTQFRIIGGYLP